MSQPVGGPSHVASGLSPGIGWRGLPAPAGGYPVIRETSIASSINVGDDDEGGSLINAYRPFEGPGDNEETGYRSFSKDIDVRSDIAAVLVEDPVNEAAQRMHVRLEQLHSIWQQTSAWDRFQMLRPWLLLATMGAVMVSVWIIAAMIQGLAVAVD